MTVQSKENASKSIDDEMVSIQKGKRLNLKFWHCKAALQKNIQDLILDIGSSLSLVSSQFLETIINGTQLQLSNGHYITLNESLLNIK